MSISKLDTEECEHLKILMFETGVEMNHCKFMFQAYRGSVSTFVFVFYIRCENAYNATHWFAEEHSLHDVLSLDWLSSKVIRGLQCWRRSRCLSSVNTIVEAFWEVGSRIRLSLSRSKTARNPWEPMQQSYKLMLILLPALDSSMLKGATRKNTLRWWLYIAKAVHFTI